jgi:hypothetical protein
VFDDVDAGDADLAGGRQGAGGADADGGGFAGAVGAEQAVDLAGTNAEVDAIDGDDALLAVVDLSQAFWISTSPFSPVCGIDRY